MDISRRILQDCAGKLELDFFFYATTNNEKANFLTYIDVPKQDNYDKELFYLKWCYNDQFDYCNEENCNDSENYVANLCTYWGLSVSAAVCLVHRSKNQKAFIEHTFQPNFRNQYLLTYILLLHQKYMMYLFLTNLSFGIDGRLDKLEKYQDRLYRFETRYMLTYISEVPQYQHFYTKVRSIFALQQMFQDVQEPLLQLEQISEKERQKQEARTTAALGIPVSENTQRIIP